MMLGSKVPNPICASTIGFVPFDPSIILLVSWQNTENVVTYSAYNMTRKSLAFY